MKFHHLLVECDKCGQLVQIGSNRLTAGQSRDGGSTIWVSMTCPQCGNQDEMLLTDDA